MKALVWVTTTAVVVYGAISYLIIQSHHSSALEEARKLQYFEARIAVVHRCPGKSLCYLTKVSYQSGGKKQTANVFGNLGEEGKPTNIWTIPGSPNAYVSPEAYVKQSNSFIPMLFLPVAFLILPPLLLALQARKENREIQFKVERHHA